MEAKLFTETKVVDPYLVTVEWHWRGQRRRYGDSEFDAILTFIDQSTGQPNVLDLPTVKRLAGHAMRYGGEVLDTNERDKWWMPFFTRPPSRTGDHSWRVHITDPYTD